LGTGDVTDSTLNPLGDDVPHWFERQDIKWWGKQICRERYRSEYEQKK
jgi:hypothetical protein